MKLEKEIRLLIENIDEILPKIEVGLGKYLSIMEKLEKVDVSIDREFQRQFNGFYRIRQRPSQFYKEYYDFLESKKGKVIDFEDILLHFHETLGRIESSFSSKLLATINPNKPVWDKFVLLNLGLKSPAYGKSDETSKRNRIKKIAELYKEMENWYLEIFKLSETKNLIKKFDDYYPDSRITDTKKIDLILWQSRS